MKKTAKKPQKSRFANLLSSPGLVTSLPSIPDEDLQNVTGGEGGVSGPKLPPFAGD